MSTEDPRFPKSPPARTPARAAPARAVERGGPEAEDDRLASLPRWAQDEVKRLRRALTEARQERDEALDHPFSQVCYQRNAGIGGDGPRYVFLPEDTPVRFYLDRDAAKADRLRGYIEVHLSMAPQRRPHVRIATSKQIAVYPIAANCFNALEVDDAP